MFIKVTALGIRSNIADVSLNEPKVVLVNAFKIWTIVPTAKGSELRDDSGKNAITVQESPEELYEMLK